MGLSEILFSFDKITYLLLKDYVLEVEMVCYYLRLILLLILEDLLDHFELNKLYNKIILLLVISN